VKLAETFASALAPPADERLEDAAGLERRLQAILQQAKAAWGGSFQCQPEAFVRYLAERIPEEQHPGEALERLHTSDLYLAFGCASAASGALEAFESHCDAPIMKVVRRLRVPEHQAEEVRQQLRERLFVPRGERPPVIRQYTGRGRLAEWVRIACLRAILKQRSRKHQEVPVEQQILADAPAAEPDPELRYLKETYRVEFKEAFREALASLSKRQRALLRMYFFEDKNVDKLGAAFKVHRSTAARWLAEARGALLARTRAALSHRMALADDEWNSVMGLIESRLDITFRSLIGVRK
jgi:RNA polymerase sigma-70 factor (ECF subfamily)